MNKIWNTLYKLPSPKRVLIGKKTPIGKKFGYRELWNWGVVWGEIKSNKKINELRYKKFDTIGQAKKAAKGIECVRIIEVIIYDKGAPRKGKSVYERGFNLKTKK